MRDALLLQEPLPGKPLGWEAPISGCYPGTVVGNFDPDAEGKIQVRVDQVYGAASEEEKIEDVDLPFARPAFATTGAQSGAPWVPPIGAGVWVMFWGGNPEFPVWFGGFYGTGEVPAEFASSYVPDPRTNLIKTENGHLIEMRWVPGDSYIRVRTADGFQVLLDDTNKRAEVSTPGLRKMVLDESVPLAEFATIATPTQKVELLDTPPGTINIQTAGNAAITALGTATITAAGVAVNSTGGAPTTHTGGGTLTSTFVGAAIYNFAGALTYLIVGLYALTAAGITLTSAATILVTTGVPIVLGSLAGTKRKLAHDQLMVMLAQFIYAYENHDHGGLPVPPTILVSTQVGSPPNVGTPMTNVPAGNVSLDANTMLTVNVKAD